MEFVMRPCPLNNFHDLWHESWGLATLPHHAPLRVAPPPASAPPIVALRRVIGAKTTRQTSPPSARRTAPAFPSR